MAATQNKRIFRAKKIREGPCRPAINDRTHDRVDGARLIGQRKVEFNVYRATTRGKRSKKCSNGRNGEGRGKRICVMCRFSDNPQAVVCRTNGY